MYNSRKVILVLDRDKKFEKFYHGAFEGAGHIIEVAQSEKDFWPKLNEIVPDLVIFRQSYESGGSPTHFCIKCKSLPGFRKIKFLYADNDHSVARRIKLEKEGIEYIGFPCSQMEILSKVNSLVKDATLFGVTFTESHKVMAQVFIDIVEVNETHFKIRGPIKLNQNSGVECYGHFFDFIGLEHHSFDVAKVGMFKEEKLFESECSLMGVGAEVYRNIKKYKS